MTSQDLTFLARLLKLRSGFVLGPEKGYLVESRLGPVARRNGFAGVGEIMRSLRHSADDGLLRQVTEAMAIEESYFFRDRAPFETLTEHVVPELTRARRAARGLRLWSAGCATGQEPYSMAMALRETRHRLAGWRVEIVATDLSSESLDTARAGLYSQFDVQRGLPIQLLVKYFHKVGWLWRIDESLRAMVDFRQHNLLDGCAALGTFDVVFCRNVLLYLDAADRRAVLARIADRMRPGGFLVLGLAETAMAASEAFEPDPRARGLFVRRDAVSVERGATPRPATRPMAVG